MKRVLVIWPTYREDWMLVFKQLTTGFEFVFLPSLSKASEEYASGFAKSVYWSDYSNANDLLNDVDPDFVIFMSIDNGLSIVLNYQAKKRGLKTFVLQHGIYTNYKDYRTRERLWRKRGVVKNVEAQKRKVRFSSLTFISSSLPYVDFSRLFFILLYTLCAKRFGNYWAARHLPSNIKNPDFYICFSLYNSIIHKETDRASEDQIRFVGSPELDMYLQHEIELLSDRFYLHIDQALAENSFGEETVSKNEMIDFYRKLNAYCKRQNTLLYIKLHPESYNSNWLPVEQNIVYLKHVENFNLYIQSAIGCFGFYSTMVIPAMYWKRTILFNINYSGLQEVVKSLKLAKVMSFWTFEIDDITFNETDDFDRETLIKTFFYSNDRRSIERIKNALLN